MAINRRATEFAGYKVEPYVPAVGVVMSSMPRREFRLLDKAGQFWAITLERDRIVVQSGKAGAEVETQVVGPRAPGEIRDEYRRLISEKVAAHYAPHQAPAEAGSLGGALYWALKANPDDKASRMALADHLAEQGEQPHPVAYRVDGDGTPRQLEAFLKDPLLGLVQALVVGYCFDQSGEGSTRAVKLLVDARERLPNLKALFFGDLTYNDREISWINLSDLTGLFTAFPQLEHFRSRGGNGLVVKEFEHKALKSLAFEASNLPRGVVQAVGASNLPALEHLELWLGTSEYGADTTPEDLAGILEGRRLPSLRYLGLRNSEIADGVARALAGAPILERLRVLDLSLGNLGDEGAEALLDIPGLARLERLDIHHHYVSPETVERLEELGISVDASDPLDMDDPDDPESRYVAHAE